MNTVLVTAPTRFPLYLPEVKNFLKLEDGDTDDDALCMAMLRAAVEAVESFLNRKLITQTWDLKLDAFPCGRIEPPYGALQSVTSITYIDTNGDSQVWSSSLYQVDTTGVLGRIEPAYGEVYPTTRDVLNAVTVRFVCGYGDDPADVPETIRLAILMVAKAWYDNRGEGDFPKAAEMLLLAASTCGVLEEGVFMVAIRKAGSADHHPGADRNAKQHRLRDHDMERPGHRLGAGDSERRAGILCGGQGERRSRHDFPDSLPARTDE